jgi:hypothetical protein
MLRRDICPHTPNVRNTYIIGSNQLVEEYNNLAVRPAVLHRRPGHKKPRTGNRTERTGNRNRKNRNRKNRFLFGSWSSGTEIHRFFGSVLRLTEKHSNNTSNTLSPYNCSPKYQKPNKKHHKPYLPPPPDPHRRPLQVPTAPALLCALRLSLTPSDSEVRAPAAEARTTPRRATATVPSPSRRCVFAQRGSAPTPQGAAPLLQLVSRHRPSYSGRPPPSLGPPSVLHPVWPAPLPSLTSLRSRDPRAVEHVEVVRRVASRRRPSQSDDGNNSSSSISSIWGISSPWFDFFLLICARVVHLCLNFSVSECFCKFIVCLTSIVRFPRLEPEPNRKNRNRTVLPSVLVFWEPNF